MSKVKRQHYVPQFYLKQWHNEKSNEQIYVYDKDTKKSYSTNIKGIASSNYFYDYPELTEEQKKEFIEKVNNSKEITAPEKEQIIKNIDKQIIENLLSEIETINSTILNSIIMKLNNIKALPINYFLHHNFINNEEIIDLSYFIALQYVRTEEMRIVHNDMNKWFTKIMLDNLLQNIDKYEYDKEFIKKMGGIEEVNNFKNNIKNGKIDIKNFEINIDETYNKINHLSSIFELAEEISKYLMNYKWIILINNTFIPFITTDNPVIKKANLNMLFSTGFSSKGIEIYYPISPKYAISIWEPSYFKEIAPDLFNQTILEIKESNVIHNNDLLIQSSTSQIYSKINDFTWVEKRIKDTPSIANKKRPRINS